MKMAHQNRQTMNKVYLRCRYQASSNFVQLPMRFVVAIVLHENCIFRVMSIVEAAVRRNWKKNGYTHHPTHAQLRHTDPPTRTQFKASFCGTCLYTLSDVFSRCLNCSCFHYYFCKFYALFTLHPLDKIWTLSIFCCSLECNYYRLLVLIRIINNRCLEIDDSSNGS